MFCPECRRYWNTPQPAEKSGKPFKAPQPVRCSACGALLARDRMVAEFPPAEQQAQTADRGVGGSNGSGTERRMTVQEVLRETAGPNALASFNALPSLDPGGNRDDDSGRRARHEPLNDSDWTSSDTPKIPRSFGRAARPRLATIDVILGLGSLAAMIVVIISFSVRSLSSMSRATAATPTARLVRAAMLGAPVASAATVSPPSLPARVGDWQRAGQIVSVSASPAVSEAVYACAQGTVHVWYQVFASGSAAQSALRAAASTSGPLAARIDIFGEYATVAADAPASNSAIPSSPGVVTLPHSRSWVAGATMITVASDSAPARDSFALAYLGGR